jgi:NitT/TauT family transport system ATP-binding protein
VSAVASLHDVQFTYPNGTRAISSLTLDIDEGRILGICGPSGCGKTSLLNILAGLRSPTAGTIDWFAGPADARHPISMVFQKDTLLPWRTVEQNAGFYHSLNRDRRAGSAELIAELVEMVGLADFAKAYPYQLSGGMRRRLAFIGAVAAQPRLLLLDEPFISLDEPTKIGIHQDVLRIVRHLGMTVVIVTHDLAEAASLCDRVHILKGRPTSIATTHDVALGSERSVLDLRHEPSFLAIYGALWEDLTKEILHSRTDDGS